MSVQQLWDCIGNTPCIEVQVDGCCLFAKAEFLNPGGSIKDRMVWHIIAHAEQGGKLRKGMHIAEASSGNTGIAIAMIGASRGYRVTICMPENASAERQKILKFLGAEVVLTPAEESVEGAVKALCGLLESQPETFTLNQFANSENIEAHYQTTATELWNDLNGCVDCFVSGVGSGGTLMGVSRYLRNHNPDVHIVAVEPKGSSALLGHAVRPHSIEGIGDGFVPEIVELSLIDEICEVDDAEAIGCASDLARTQGVMAGISSGANLVAAARVASLHPDWTVATLLPDRAERYFSTQLFSSRQPMPTIFPHLSRKNFYR
ncbi:PLP-dependent cysteine synthase family protein [Pseudodesulfovibrio piezophilus]|uniref:cysteine synthase n=1 Tax=Pseudodesulfovibrio piezophilus (strain DSM 21447 / JCM 15486 / C1TLV30) TaxID=1322246 RepID=M1WRR9_PSEP2|nr:cysteine synthase family protein [Pseudodesulfovibrio piezophilus]CCH48467.1 Cysteine synthase [Pseudodesulfovibrio piezophilus C1TLV30]